jgi:hypothetical protein
MKKNIIIFDLDGTLALIDHRKHLVEKKAAYEAWIKEIGPEELYRIQEQIPDKANFQRFEIKTGWKPNWDAFFEACDQDLPNFPVIETFKLLTTAQMEVDHGWGSVSVVIFSGRSDSVAEKTQAWLRKYYIFPNLIRMRPAGDYTPDEQLKEKWMQELGGPERILCVYDDRDKVVKMWRSHGIACFQVAPGDF